jgi:ribose transport system substrate-binding protein
VRVLDRKKHNLWSSVATSTLSGLCVGAITWSVGSLFKLRLLTTGVPLWAFASVAVALLASLYFLWNQRRSRTPKAKRVFLAIPAFDQKHYVAELVRNMHTILEQRGFALELKIPHRDYSTVGQAHCLKRILEHKDDYVGGFVVPVIPEQAERIRSDLVTFCRNVAVPVVFVDVEPFESEQLYPASTAFVGYASGEIGTAAARWATEHLTHLKRPCPVVLVVTGDSQHLRQARFKEYLNAHLNNVQIFEVNGAFDRLRARDVTRKQLKQAQVNNREIDLIFCTNDEMALGTVDTLLFAEPKTASETVVIGVDGTPQARALIEAGPSPLRATITQDSYKVAENAVDLLERILREDQVPTCTFLSCEVIAWG